MGLLEFVARISLNSSAFQQGMKQVKHSVRDAAREMGNELNSHLAGIIGTGAIIRAMEKLVEYGSKIAETSQKIGVSKRDLQAYEYAASQTGATIEDLEKSFKALSKARLAALQNPGGEEAQVFSALGVTGSMLSSQNLKPIFEQVAEAIRTTDFGPATQAMLDKIMGKGATNLIPLFEDGLQDLIQKFDDLGIAIDDDTILTLKEAGDAFKELTAQVRGPLAQAFKYLIDLIGKMISGGKFLVGGVGAAIGAGAEAAKEKGGFWNVIKDLMMPSGAAVGRPGAMGSDILRKAGEAFWDNAQDVIADEEKAHEQARKVREPNARVKRDFTFDQTRGGFSRDSMLMRSDSLTSIGNFLGMDPNSKTLSKLDSLEKVLLRIEANQRSSRGIASFPL